MAKKRFALIMKDGLEVRNIDDLKAHFDMNSVVREFKDGRLLTWLEDRYYDEEAAAIKKILPGDDYLAQKLCKIFGVETPEDIARRAERLNRLKNYTSDKNILANVDRVAFDQEDLADLLDEDVDEIYLCANRFVIPLRMKNKNYIGVGDAVAVIRSKEPVDFGKLNIKFKKISFDDDYKKILPPPPPPKNKKILPPPPKNSGLTIKNIGVNRFEATTTIKNIAGVHARPASIFVQRASYFRSKIYLKAKGKTVDAKSILMTMSMGLVYGTEITIIAEGSDAFEAVATLIMLVDSKFGED